MHLKLPVVLLSAFALAAPGAMVHGKDNNKNKDKKEQKSDDRRDDRHDDDRNDKVTICHGNGSARHTINVSESAWDAHRSHGDYRGPCRQGNPRDRQSFNERDTNNDDRLSFSEFGGDRATFDRLDRNNDGMLIRVEFYRR